jgi:hypothetical protein
VIGSPCVGCSLNYGELGKMDKFGTFKNTPERGLMGNNQVDKGSGIVIPR